ncbi:hypothetical protein N6H14_28835 [Paenibacillus sp. CC-CFT747]|nr:hypothetical protein N6H14_28835 [Paenibacillus sp. CC-CFT747]
MKQEPISNTMPSGQGRQAWIEGWWREEKLLIVAGLLGFILVGLCAIWVLLFGGEVAPGETYRKRSPLMRR